MRGEGNVGVTPTAFVAVEIVSTSVCGALAHHWRCAVCGEQSKRWDAKQNGAPRKDVITGATAHAKRHTDAQDALDAKVEVR